MKAKADAIIHLEQAEYLDRLLPASSLIIAEMEDDAHRNNVPIADREVALFLEITARAMKARRVLEIGMAIGYAVIRFGLTFYRQEVVLLWGLQEAQVIALVTGALALAVLLWRSMRRGHPSLAGAA